uniref:Junctional adhesion molecule A n=1 Tax=Vombatus ursinus TaxID=29139 RepID=A0A4X2LNC7_VOMUR
MAERDGQRHLLFFFTAATLYCSALGGVTVYTSQQQVKVDENQPATLHCSYVGFSSPRPASYEGRVVFSQTGISFHSVTRKDSGLYTCMVTENGGREYGEITVELLVLVPPSKPTVSIPSSATIGNRVVLTCSEEDGSPPPQYQWFKDGILMPLDPKKTRAFINSSYTIDSKTGELVFEPLSAFDTGEYSCQAYNGVGNAKTSEIVRMEAAEPNVGGIVAAVIVALILLGLLIFGVWFAYSRGYFSRTSKGTTSKKVIYSQPSARSDGEFRQTSSFLV